MKPLNKKQRNAAIAKFILIYMLALALIAIPIFALFEIPEAQCDINEKTVVKLQSDLDKCREDKKALSSKGEVSTSLKANLKRLHSDYVEYTKVLADNVDSIDNIVANDNVVFDEKIIQRISNADIKIFDSKKKLIGVNESFEKLLKDI